VSEDAETYRGRAEHARLAAKSAIDKQQRSIFEKLAASYEARANEAERLERGSPASADRVERLRPDSFTPLRGRPT
jgi:hypothetical protein